MKFFWSCAVCDYWPARSD